MFRLLLPCLIWLSTVRSETGMRMSSMPGEPVMDRASDTSMLKTKRDSIHQPCGPIYSHIPAYAPPSVYVKPLVQQTYLKKELGLAQPLAHLQYVQQPPAYTSVVPKPAVSYVKPVVPAVNYHAIHQPVQYIKPVTPVYQKPMLSYAPVYQKPLYGYAPMYQQPVYHDAMPKVFVKSYETPEIAYQKSLIHPAVQYAAPKVLQIQASQLPYVKPLVHVPSPPLYAPQPVHNSVIVKPDCV